MEHTVVVTMTKTYESNDLENILSGALTGCSYWCSDLDFESSDYAEAKTRLKVKGKKDLCYEEVLVEMLENGKSIWFCDNEEDEQYELTLEKLLNGIALNCERRPKDCDIDDGDDITMDCIIQYALFEDVIFC